MDRIVPGRDDQTHASGLVANLRGRAEHAERASNAVRLRPGLQVPPGVGYLLIDREEFGQPHLRFRLPEISIQRPDDVAFAPLDRLLQPRQAIQAFSPAETPSFQFGSLP